MVMITKYLRSRVRFLETNGIEGGGSNRCIKYPHRVDPLIGSVELHPTRRAGTTTTSM